MVGSGGVEGCGVSRKLFEIGAKEFKVLQQAAKDGKPLSVVCKKLGVHRNVIKRACRDALLSSWLEENFPKQQGVGSRPEAYGRELASKVDGGLRKLKLEQIGAPLKVPETVQAKWLTRRWAA